METAISLFITTGKNISTFQKGKNHGLLSLRDFVLEPLSWSVAGAGGGMVGILYGG